MQTSKRGFTHVELILVIAILAIIASIVAVNVPNKKVSHVNATTKAVEMYDTPVSITSTSAGVPPVLLSNSVIQPRQDTVWSLFINFDDAFASEQFKRSMNAIGIDTSYDLLTPTHYELASDQWSVSDGVLCIKSNNKQIVYGGNFLLIQE